MMLNSRSDDMLPRFRKAENCQVIALGAATGKDNLRRPASQQGRYRLARTLHRRPRLLSVVMDGRCVAKALPETGLHSRKDFGQDRRCSVIVEINATHRLSPLFYAIYGIRIPKAGRPRKNSDEENLAHTE